MKTKPIAGTPSNANRGKRPSSNPQSAQRSTRGFPCLFKGYPWRAVRLILLLFVAAAGATLARGQTALVNGGNQAGTLVANTTNSFTLTASTGDIVVLRLGTTGFNGVVNLYGPTGAFLKTAYSGVDAELDYTATNSGTFTVHVQSFVAGGTGTYVLHLAQFPESFTVPAGDEGGPLANGGNHAGTNSLGDLDMWSLTANSGDNIVLRLGTTGFDGYLSLYGPDGALLKIAYSGTDAELDYTATNSGTFTALVKSFSSGGTGTYVLHLAQFPESFTVPAGDEGGPMTNGGNHAGTNSLGDLDMWSLTANAGDNIVLRLGTTGFDGYLSLYGPNGALLKIAYSDTDAELDYTATNSGTFTALVRSYFSAGTGTYVLHVAEFPEAFIVPAGDEGGSITSGGDYPGTNTLGDLDMWSFAANAGDNIVLRLGTTGFDGYLSLYGPNGALLKIAYSGTDAELDYTATNSGTFTALARSYYSVGTGTYALHLARFPGPFIVPPGDQGGFMTSSGTYTGTITLGGLDLWAFTACTHDSINLRLNPTNFTGNIDLYGPTGALLKSVGSSTAAQLNYTATNCGTFIVLVSSYYSGGTGTYGLTANGLSYGLKLCYPVLGGPNLILNGVGGTSNVQFVLYTTTNAPMPFYLWTPVFTNRFDQFGVLSYTNAYNPLRQQQYFRLSLP